MMRNNRDGTFRDVTARIRPQSEQHALQFLLRLGRLQPRRLARPLRRERFRPEESLSQQRRRHVYRRRAASGRGRCRRGHERLLVRLRQRRCEDLYVADMWTAAGERISTQDIFQKDRRRKFARSTANTPWAIRCSGIAGDDAISGFDDTSDQRASAWAAGRGRATPGISIMTAFPISTSPTA